MCKAGMDPEKLGLGSGPYEAGGLLKGQKAQGRVQGEPAYTLLPSFTGSLFLSRPYSWM